MSSTLNAVTRVILDTTQTSARTRVPFTVREAAIGKLGVVPHAWRDIMEKPASNSVLKSVPKAVTWRLRYAKVAKRDIAELFATRTVQPRAIRM